MFLFYLFFTNLKISFCIIKKNFFLKIVEKVHFL
nr:MAG TPA: hypothetical protein [Caudoviricetes sp.]